MDAPAGLAFEGVEVAYPGGAFRLAVPSLALAGAERVALVGPSGSGKTTLVNLAAGLLAPDRGSVRARGVDVTALSPRARRAWRLGEVGLVFQELELLESLSALENVLLPYRLAAPGAPPPDARRRARELARAAGIDALLARRPSRLSQGERQRVAVCRALVTGPSLVLADEPTGNLDPDNARRTLDLLFERCADAGATLLLVTHDPATLDRFDRVVDTRELGGGA